MNETVVLLDINDLIPNRFQPREFFREENLQELSQSIKEHGVIQPIIVRPVGNKYEIIAGERRYKASVLAGKVSIPAIVRSLDDKETAKQALLENTQRQDLSAIEEARTYQIILDLDQMTQEELAKTMGKSQSAISNKLRLLSLPSEVQEAVMEGKISERHARSLLSVDDTNEQLDLLNKIIKNRIPVRILEQLIKENANTNKGEKIQKDTENIDMINNNDNITDKTNDSDYHIDFLSDILKNDKEEINVPNNTLTDEEFSKFKPITYTKNIVQNVSGEEIIGAGLLVGEKVEKPQVNENKTVIAKIDTIKVPTNIVEKTKPIDLISIDKERTLINQSGGVVLPTNMSVSDVNIENTEPNDNIKQLLKSEELKYALIAVNNIVNNLKSKGIEVNEIHKTFNDHLELVLELKK